MILSFLLFRGFFFRKNICHIKKYSYLCNTDSADMDFTLHVNTQKGIKEATGICPVASLF